MSASCENIIADVKYLTENIGVRLAGSENDKKACRYLCDRFREYCDDVSVEDFQVMERAVESQKLSVQISDAWQEFPCSAFAGAVTTFGNDIVAPLAFFDPHTDYQRADLSFLRGKAVLHYGYSTQNSDNYRRLMAARPAFLMIVDTRYTSTTPLADGMFPAHVNSFGSVPTVNVGFFDAQKIFSLGEGTPVKLNIDGISRPAKSASVIANYPGEDEQTIYLTAHLDTQADTVGADDNAIGCAMILELARLLSTKKHKHTLKIIAFGAEEQLSLGSAAFVRCHRSEVGRYGRFIFNFDSCGSTSGWNKWCVNADSQLRNILHDFAAERDIFFEELYAPSPFLDQFPFSSAGVAGVTLGRKNCETGCFYHHRPGNTINVISGAVAAKLTDFAADFTTKLLDEPDLENLCRFPVDLNADVQKLWQEIFGGWD